MFSLNELIKEIKQTQEIINLARIHNEVCPIISDTRLKNKCKEKTMKKILKLANDFLDNLD